MVYGILGGSFNPPHVGHLALARTVLDLGLVERVCLIPAAIPPHKAAPTQAAPSIRLAMTELLAKSDPRLSVNAIELERAGLSYTVDTLRELHRLHPADRFRLIIGSDLAKTFATWREYKEVLRLAPPLVAERPDAEFTGEGDYAGMTPEEASLMAAGRFPMRPMAVSSTLVRKLLAEGADDARMLAYLTPPVLDYVREHRLYRAENDLPH